MSYKLLNNVTAVGASAPIRMANYVGVKDHTITGHLKPTGVTAVTGITVTLQGATDNMDAYTGVITGPGLTTATTGGGNGYYPAIGTTFYYLINGTNYSAAAATAGQGFSASHVINSTGSGDLFGCINIYIDVNGTIQTAVPAANQNYATAAAAVAAAEVLTATGPDGQPSGTYASPNWCLIGRLILESNGATWTANSSTIASATASQWVSKGSKFVDFLTHVMTPAELTACEFFDSIKGVYFPYVRMFLKAATGGGFKFTGIYAPEESP